MKIHVLAHRVHAPPRLGVRIRENLDISQVNVLPQRTHSGRSICEVTPAAHAPFSSTSLGVQRPRSGLNTRAPHSRAVPARRRGVMRCGARWRRVLVCLADRTNSRLRESVHLHIPGVSPPSANYARSTSTQLSTWVNARKKLRRNEQWRVGGERPPALPVGGAANGETHQSAAAQASRTPSNHRPR